jgi:hypothetical protein
MPLRKLERLTRSAGATAEQGSEGKKSKRQRLIDFFNKHRKHKGAGSHGQVAEIPIATTTKQTAPPEGVDGAADTKPDASPAKSSTSIDAAPPDTQKEGQAQLSTATSTPPPEPQEEEKVQPLSVQQLHTLFSGAPHFGLEKSGERVTPRASFPWDDTLAVRDVSDSVQLAHPAFSAATLRKHLPVLHQSSEQDKIYLSYDPGVVEIPSMLSAQGIEPGTTGFVSFLELPISDALVTDLQQSQSSNGFLEAVRNKEQMQSNPERLGIRKVDMAMIYDRLLEFGDLIEVFQDSPERMTILNNQSCGDLYANLFGKFLMPPKYDDSADDPTGMKVQIDTLLRILRLKGIWYDFSLVEWRIRLGQILWSESTVDALDDTPAGQLWSEREILLLQITLACELLLRLDAVTSMDPDEVKSEMRVSPGDYHGFLDLKSRKTDWDMVLARRFLDNIVVMKGGPRDDATQASKSRGLLSLLSTRNEPKESPEPEIVLLPRHQGRQLSGLVCFAEAMCWPSLDTVIEELVGKLGIPESPDETEQQQIPTHRSFLEPSISSSLSVYGTPLATPRSARDSYFGNVTNINAKPALERDNSQTTQTQSLTLPLSTTLISNPVDAAANTFSVGGWLSRSYLTGLILPGEAISHFLMSTLLENDKLAIAALGDTANLYGGFVYAERSWWSKNCIVGRVIACMEGAVECMGWISIPKVPDALSDGWYSVKSEPLQPEQPVRITSGITAESDLVFKSSAFVPDGITANVMPEHLTLPIDSPTPPVPSVVLSEWTLTPITPEVPESDELSASPSEAETCIATWTFASFSRGTSHAFTLTHDVQFITSFPCTPPKATAPGFETPAIQKTPLSRSPSKRSIHSAKSASVNKRLSRISSRRSSHGFEPLLSHPPDSPSVQPKRVYSPIPDEDIGDNTVTPKPEPMLAHPLHISYKYRIAPVTDVLDPNYQVPFKVPVYASSGPSNQSNTLWLGADEHADGKTVLVLDARDARDLELLARAWCAEKGLHAVISRVGRTCLACSVREARGLGVNVVVRV